MFKSKAKQRAHEAFMARQTFRTKTQKRRDFEARAKMNGHSQSSQGLINPEHTVNVTHCPSAMPRGTFAGTVTFKGKTTKTFIPCSHLNAKKAKSVADPCQSWIAHW
jgi:hypothetical protein